MLSPETSRRRCALALIVLAGWFLWSAWREIEDRSLIPIGISGVVTSRQILTEKHPGRDDVHQVIVETAAEMVLLDRLPKTTWQALVEGAEITKEPGDLVVRVNDQEVELFRLEWGSGIILALAAGFLAMLALLLFDAFARFRSADPETKVVAGPGR